MSILASSWNLDESSELIIWLQVCTCSCRCTYTDALVPVHWLSTSDPFYSSVPCMPIFQLKLQYLHTYCITSHFEVSRPTVTDEQIDVKIFVWRFLCVDYIYSEEKTWIKQPAQQGQLLFPLFCIYQPTLSCIICSRRLSCLSAILWDRLRAWWVQ